MAGLKFLSAFPYKSHSSGKRNLLSDESLEEFLDNRLLFAAAGRVLICKTPLLIHTLLLYVYMHLESPKRYER